MTEHSAVIFVMFFLAEYASILLICILTASLFLGGYLLDLTWFVDLFIYILEFIDIDYALELKYDWISSGKSIATNGLISGLILGIKSSALVFTFIWVRASLPRIRFDQLMNFCWTVLLPLLFAFIVFVPCILFSFDAFVVDGVSLLALPLLATNISDFKKSDFLVITDLKYKDFKLLPLYRLMSFLTVLLPLLFAFIVLVPCLLFSLDAFVVDGLSLLSLPLLATNVSDIKKSDMLVTDLKSKDFKSLPLRLHWHIYEGWTVFMSLLFAFIVLVPCLLFSLDAFVTDYSLLALPLVVNGVIKDSDTTKDINMTDWEFNQWFSGFTDAEGCFIIEISNSDVISFAFYIGLHLDDKAALEYIQKRLNTGRIRESGSRKVTFTLKKINDINTILIPLFEKFPLNGVKYLDYLAFKEAVNIKLNDCLSKEEKLKLITALKNSMNSKRTYFEMPDSHTIRITPYWLLGLIEGEGTFCLNDIRNMGMSFSVCLTAVQAPLIHAIKNFLDTYAIEDNDLKTSTQYLELVSQRSYFNLKKASTKNAYPGIELAVRQLNFIVNQLIPMLSDLSFVTKKYKDFLDWKIIASLIYKGKHNTEEGRELIIKISQGMNNYRLSTYTRQYSGEYVKIFKNLMDKVLNMEDIYKKDKDGFRIKASNGTLIKSQLFYILATSSSGENILFKDSKTCADFFLITSKTINVRLATKQSVLLNNIEYQLSRRPI